MSETTSLAAFRRETVEAIEAVRQGLKLIQSRAGASDVMPKDVSYKAGRDIVTATDLAVEDAVRAMLTSALGLTVIGEERGGQAAAGASHWLIDPICGTRNYASGIPLYSINLALVESGEVTVGLVGDPSRDEIVVAERGGGAWALTDGKLRLLQASDESHTVIIEEPDGGDGSARGARREHGARFMAEVIRADRWEFRSLGATLSMAYLAAGRIAAYVVFYGTAVHCAAGTIVASEGGCTVTDIAGQPWTPASTSLLLAATPALHAELLAMAQRTRP